jgi:hypothetical protein
MCTYDDNKMPTNDAVETVDYVANPLAYAQYASAVLAADKGVPSTIRTNSAGYDVIAEGRIFRFLHTK